MLIHVVGSEGLVVTFVVSSKCWGQIDDQPSAWLLLFLLRALLGLRGTICEWLLSDDGGIEMGSHLGAG